MASQPQPGRGFFTGDQHFNHVRILQYSQRPFASVEEMNEALIARFNETVGPDDTVYILGDLVMGKDLRCAGRLNGHKKLLMGNHDTQPPEAYEALGIQVIRENGIPAKSFFYEGCRVVHSPTPVMREVFPAITDRTDGYREIQRRGVLNGLTPLCLCGHVHRLFRKLGNFVNVGVDVWDYRPVLWQTARFAFLEPDSAFA